MLTRSDGEVYKRATGHFVRLIQGDIHLITWTYLLGLCRCSPLFGNVVEQEFPKQEFYILPPLYALRGVGPIRVPQNTPLRFLILISPRIVTVFQVNFKHSYALHQKG